MNNIAFASADELQQLREWLSKIPYVDLSLCDDNFLQHYYVHRNGSLQETKETIHNYFKAIFALGKPYYQLDPTRKGTEEYYNCSKEFLLQKVTDDGTTCVSYHFLKPPVCKNYTTEGIITYRRKFLMKVLKYPPTVSKFIAVVNFENYSLSTMSYWDFPVIKLALEAFVKSAPVRISHIHCVNMSPVARAAGQMMAALVRERIKSRITVHPTLESLYSELPKKMLPSELGGELGTTDELQDEYRKMEFECKDQLLKWQNIFDRFGETFEYLALNVDTSSFRKLEVD